MSHYQAWVVRYTGARGSGKSLLLAAAGINDLIAGKKVWSNMPIKVTESAVEWGTRDLTSEQQKQAKKEYVGLESIPLDWNAFYSLSEDLVEGTVLIDEAQYFSDSRSALSMKNRLLNAIVAQVRKRSLSLYYTVKQGDWVDRRLTYETDLEITCESMHLTEWGKANGLPGGEMILTRFYDLSGAITGKPVDPRDKYFNSYRAGYFLHMSKLWDCYDTAAAIDLEEAFTPVQMDMKARRITNKATPQEITDSLYDLVGSIRDSGAKDIPTQEFWRLAGDAGIEGGSQYLGRYLPGLGVERKQKHGGSYSYDLTDFQ